MKLALENISKNYGEKKALDRISFSGENGGIWASGSQRRGKKHVNESSELYNNSFAQMVRDQGEKQAEATINQCVTRIAENGEIIRSCIRDFNREDTYYD